VNVLGGRIGQSAGENHQCRAQALAAATNNVVTDLVDQDNFRPQSFPDDPVDGLHVAINDLTDVV
jgi:hypothetical protein